MIPNCRSSQKRFGLNVQASQPDNNPDEKVSIGMQEPVVIKTRLGFALSVKAPAIPPGWIHRPNNPSGPRGSNGSNGSKVGQAGDPTKIPTSFLEKDPKKNYR